MVADSAIESIIQAAPTDWMTAPTLESVLALQTARNTGYRKGDSAERRAGAFKGSASIPAIGRDSTQAATEVSPA